MTAENLLDIIGEAKDSYVLAALQSREQTSRKRISVRKAILIAAAIAVMLLLVGCAVLYVLNLQDMKIGEYSVTRPGRYVSKWERAESEEVTYEVLSLQGFGDSPNRRAVQEWWEFTENYEVSLSDAEANAGIPDVYQSTYGCYTWEMVEKLDEIAEKYDLALLSEPVYVEIDQYQVLLDALQISGVCCGDIQAEVVHSSGYFFPEGSFNMNVDVTMTGEDAAWPYMVMADFYYSRKDFFDDTSLRVKNLDSFRQWEYTLPDGGLALIAMNEEKALILAERENAFLAVKFDTKRGIDTMTAEAVEQIADLFDFSIQTHSLSKEELAEVTATLDAMNEANLKAYQEWQAEYEKSLHKEGYDGWVKQILEESYLDTRDLGFAFWDIDGNGTEELLIGRDGYCTTAYIEVDGQTEEVSNAYSYLYPCEENKLVGVIQLGLEADYYCTRRYDGTSMGECHVRYAAGCPEGEYWNYDLTTWNKYDYISKEEFDSILDSYARIPVSFLPLSEYPLEETVTNTNRGDTSQEPFETYEDKIRVRLTDQEERWGRWAYDLRDLDGNGQEEMVWREDDRYFVYTILDGQVCCYRMVGDNKTVCENGIVESVSYYGSENRTYRYYRINGEHVELVEYLRYDVDADPEHPWSRSTDLTGQDNSLQTISQAEAEAIRAKYVPMELDMKPIKEYPFT